MQYGPWPQQGRNITLSADTAEHDLFESYLITDITDAYAMG